MEIPQSTPAASTGGLYSAPTSGLLIVTMAGSWAVGAAMSFRQQRFCLGDRLLCRQDDWGLFVLGRRDRLLVVVLATAEERGHRPEGAAPGGEREGLGQAVGEGLGDQMGEERPAGQIVGGGRRKVGERGRPE